ncbi:hypothetical protein [Streptomyces sp. NBC_00989]|uniref:hypothetical protein n=1 Tax=Streptomyces sp. NBC_00989 TaxID=2903705 RepID=UPI00386CB922|nr:hypothetical protein OG714_01260 [Streptomyces sp. NBC_00989]
MALDALTEPGATACAEYNATETLLPVTVVDTEFRTADQPAPARPASVSARSVPAKPLPQQDHHDECDKSVYDGGTCTCDLIEQYGPPCERDDY